MVDDFDKTRKYLEDVIMPFLREIGFIYKKTRLGAYWLLEIDCWHSAHLFINHIAGYIGLEINSETVWRKDRLDTFEEFERAFENLRTFLTT